ncbi:MAG: hypothetical protein GXO89_15190 [Chlorobi bacterium]|nr:hypothetical protein [Chlorobiota bacterium]
MKKANYICKLLLSLLVMFLTQDLTAGFEILKSGTSENLKSVYFVSGRVGYTVGDNGTVIKTRNGGKSWISLETHTHINLKGVWFIDRETGFVIGDRNTILSTDDGGRSWSEVDVPIVADYTAIQFVDPINGYIVGQHGKGGVFLKTSDGGTTWTCKIINVNCADGNNPGSNYDKLYLQTISFLDLENGIIGGYSYNAISGKRPFVCKTSDGGKTFRNISPAFRKSEWSKGYEIRSLNYVTEHDAYGIRNQGFNKSFLYAGNYDLKGFENISSGFDHEYHSLYYSSVFLDRLTGYVCSVINGRPQVLKTIDAGESYMFLTPPTDDVLYGMFFTDEKSAFFVGKNGTVLHLEDNTNSEQSLFVEVNENMDIPFSIAAPKSKMDVTHIFVYNIKVSEKKDVSVSFFDKYGKEIEVKNSHVRLFKKEFRMKVKTNTLTYGTYFYTIKLKEKAVLNGKLDIGSFVQNEW